MSIFPKPELKRLLEQYTEGCVSVSIFMPSFRTGADAQQSPIRLRNLLRDAERRLVESGMRSPEALRLLEPA